MSLFVLCVMLNRFVDPGCIDASPAVSYALCTRLLVDWQAEAWAWTQRSHLDDRGPFSICNPRLRTDDLPQSAHGARQVGAGEPVRVIEYLLDELRVHHGSVYQQRTDLIYDA